MSLQSSSAAPVSGRPHGNRSSRFGTYGILYVGHRGLIVRCMITLTARLVKGCSSGYGNSVVVKSGFFDTMGLYTLLDRL